MQPITAYVICSTLLELNLKPHLGNDGLIKSIFEKYWSWIRRSVTTSPTFNGIFATRCMPHDLSEGLVFSSLKGKCQELY